MDASEFDLFIQWLEGSEHPGAPAAMVSLAFARSARMTLLAAKTAEITWAARGDTSSGEYVTKLSAYVAETAQLAARRDLMVLDVEADLADSVVMFHGDE